MARSVSSVLLNLLDVFHGVCEKKEIPYILWGETARAISLSGEIPSGFVKAEVAVPAPSCASLAQALNAVDPARYECEFWGNNPRLPFMTMRFHDKQSTYFNFKQMDSFTGFGIRLEVIPLRAPSPCRSDMVSRERRRCSLLLPHTHFARCEGDRTLVIDEECLLDANSFFEPMLRGEVLQDRYEIWHPEKSVKRLSGSYLASTELIKSRERDVSLRVPKDFNAYMEKTSKRFWRDRKFGSPGKSQRVWISPELPYRLAKSAFDQANFPLEEYDSNRKKYDESKKDADRCFSQLGTSRAAVRAVHCEISVESYYGSEEQKEIIDSFVKGEWDKLRILFAPYRNWMIQSVNGKIDYPISLPTAVQIAFISLLEHDAEGQVALRAWHCLERRCSREDLARICTHLGCGRWS